MSKILVSGDVLLCKGYSANKDEEHLKELWIREHIAEISKFVQIEVKDGGEDRDVLIGGICT